MAISPDITSIALTDKEKELVDMLEAEIDKAILTSNIKMSYVPFTIEAHRRIHISQNVRDEITYRYQQAGWPKIVWRPYNQHDGETIELRRPVDKSLLRLDKTKH